VRTLCDCAETIETSLNFLLGQVEHDIKSYKMPKGCPACAGTGYRGRIPLTEALPLENDNVMRSLLDRNDTFALRETAIRNGMVPLADRAVLLIESGATSPLEIRRVFG
jgi:type II secretory ATPase GspE/PulE/Tfp pilus assembly ATPase PilB-like protein